MYIFFWNFFFAQSLSWNKINGKTALPQLCCWCNMSLAFPLLAAVSICILNLQLWSDFISNLHTGTRRAVLSCVDLCWLLKFFKAQHNRIKCDGVSSRSFNTLYIQAAFHKFPRKKKLSPTRITLSSTTHTWAAHRNGCNYEGRCLFCINTPHSLQITICMA